MKRIILFSLMSVMAMALGTAHAQEAGKTSRLGKPIFPKLEYVNLNAELGFETEVLRGFGARVDDARRDADGAAVAAQAVLLNFAEGLAGRTASTVTAVQLLAEAARIAEEQQNREAVAAVEHAATSIAGSESVVARLRDASTLFAEKRGAGEFLGFVRIENECDRLLDIYIDGKFAGFQYGGDAAVYSTGNGTTHARVTDAFGNTVSEVLFVQSDQTVTWTIKP
ncbi:MAG: hypothetical protein RBU27_07390 [Bacteroidota bacterium]|jgi:hypothetical protein|nr:hypothetical protein [Bacteroidota bacterium]